MICYDFKGGIGTSSRVVKLGDGAYTVGVLLQANFGGRSQLTVAGVPVGREIPDSPALLRTARAPRPTSARSSSSSRPTRPCCRISSNAWLAG